MTKVDKTNKRETFEITYRVCRDKVYISMKNGIIKIATIIYVIQDKNHKAINDFYLN